MKRNHANCLRWVGAFAALSVAALGTPGAPALAGRDQIRASVLGPVNEVTPLSDSQKEVIVVGRSVLVDRGLTQFQDQAGTGFGFDTLMPNDLLSVDGAVAGKQIFAEQIVKLGPFDPASLGTLEVVSAGPLSRTFVPGSFTLDNASVLVTPATVLIDLPNGIGSGTMVEVRGTLTFFQASTGFDSSFTEVTASSIRLLRRVAPPDRPGATLTGLVEGFDAATSTFLLNGLTVDAGAAAFAPATLAQSIGNSMRVTATGPIVDAVLQAETVSLPGF
jgi:hypothetical protein